MNRTARTFAGDEAGDVSFRFQHGASHHFVVALIGTADPNRLRQTLARVRSQHQLPIDFEFKFHRLGNRNLRETVWRALSAADFEAWVVVVDKQHLPDMLRVMPSRTFYAWFLNETVQLVPESLRKNAPLWLDEFDQAGKTVADFKRIARQRGLRYGFRRIRAIRSNSEDLVQVADLIAGAVLRQYERGDGEALEQLASKIAASLLYPGQQNPPG